MRWSDVRKGLLLLGTAGLIALKLTGQLGWSWVVVFAPVWVPAAMKISLQVGSAAVLGAIVYLVWTGGGIGRLVELLNQVPYVQQIPWEQWVS